MFQNYSSLVKKNIKLHESSVIIVPTTDAHKLTEFLRPSSDNYENCSNFQSSLSCPGKDLLNLHNIGWSTDLETSLRGSKFDGMYRTHFLLNEK